MPTTVMGQFKRQPLLIKAGEGITMLSILAAGSQTYGGQTVAGSLKAKDFGAAGRVFLDNATTLTSYYPLAYGVIGHWIAKTLRVKGL